MRHGTFLRTSHVQRMSAALLAWMMTGSLLFTLSAQAVQPSLVDLARQEQARRKAIRAPGKVYSDKDLKTTPPSPATGAAARDASVVPETPPAAEAPAADTAPEHDQTWWASRMAAAREEVRRNESFADALQSRINALTTDFVNRDDPYQRAKIGDDRQKAIAELERIKTEIDKAKKAIANIEEAARTAGVPPGWIR